MTRAVSAPTLTGVRAGVLVDARDLAVVAPRRHERLETADLGDGAVDGGARARFVDLARW